MAEPSEVSRAPENRIERRRISRLLGSSGIGGWTRRGWDSVWASGGTHGGNVEIMNAIPVPAAAAPVANAPAMFHHLRLRPRRLSYERLT
jgi:hypothetical protein